MAVLWVELCPLKRYIEVITPGTVTRTLLRKGVFADAIDLDRITREGLNLVDCCPYKNKLSLEDRDLQRESHVTTEAETWWRRWAVLNGAAEQWGYGAYAQR